MPRQLTIGPVCPIQLRSTRAAASSAADPSLGGSPQSFKFESKPPEAKRRQLGASHTPRMPVQCARSVCSTVRVARSHTSTRPSSDEDARMPPRMHTPYTGPECPPGPVKKPMVGTLPALVGSSQSRSRSRRSLKSTRQSRGGACPSSLLMLSPLPQVSPPPASPRRASPSPNVRSHSARQSSGLLATRANAVHVLLALQTSAALLSALKISARRSG